MAIEKAAAKAAAFCVESFLFVNVLVVDLKVIGEILEQRGRVDAVLQHDLQRLVEGEQEHAEQALGVYHAALAVDPDIKAILGDDLVDLLNVVRIIYTDTTGHNNYLLRLYFVKPFYVSFIIA